MITVSPTVPNRAWAAIQRSPAGFFATIDTVFFELGRGVEFAPMCYFVTRNTKRNAIGKFKGKFGEFRELLNMMSVQFYTTSAALLASIVIACVNAVTPYFQFSTKFPACCLARLSAFPVSRVFTCAQKPATSAGTEFGTLVSAVECFAARFTLSWFWRIAYRPTSRRAIFRALGSVGLHFVFSAAQFAYLGFLCVYHAMYYTTLSPIYCAADAFPGIDIRQVDAPTHAGII